MPDLSRQADFSLSGAALLLVAVVALVPRPADAQSPAPLPTCEAAEHRQLDFWVEEWDVTVKGQPAGRSRITSEERGCLIHEQWTGAGGGTGQSLNFYDRTDGKWHQVWVSSTGAVLRFTGRLESGSLVYAASGKRPDGTPVLHRLVFTPNADGTVRQHWTSSTDGGATWQDAFDGLYRRRGGT